MLGHALFSGCFAISLSTRQGLRCTAGGWCAGYNQATALGAPSTVVPPLPPHQGNILVDVPRWTPLLAQRLAALGGVRWIFLTHRWELVGLSTCAAACTPLQLPASGQGGAHLRHAVFTCRWAA